MAVPPAPSFYGDTIPAVVTPTDTIRFRAYCANALTLSAYFEPFQNDPMPIWYEADIEPDDVWNDVPVFYVEIPLAQTSVTAGKWRIGIQAHNNDGYSLHSFKDVRVAELPTVEITSPTEGENIENMPLVITWNSSDATGISEQQLYVYDEDLSNLVLHRTLDGDARTSVIGIEDAAFENDSEYIVIVGASNGVGLYASDTVHFRTNWAPPATPTARTNINPADLSVSVTATAGEATSATNIGEYFAHSLTDTSYWYSTNFSAAMTALTDGWARFTYTNSGSSWGYVNVSPKVGAVALTPSTAYTYLIEVRNITGRVRVNAPAISSTYSVWENNVNTDFSTDGVAHVPATTLADMGSATMVRTYLAVPANSTVTCDIRLSLYAGEYDGPYVPYDPPATASLMVTRVGADGTRWVVASGMASGDTCVDPLPPLGVEYSYAVTAVTEAGATSVATVTRTVESTAWALNFGATAGEVMTLVGNPKASYSLDQGGKAYHFADGGAGGGLPVWYGTTDRDESGTLSFDTKGPQETDRLRELCRQYPVGWIRDPFGHRWRAHVQPKISHGVGDLWAASVTWDAVRYREAW